MRRLFERALSLLARCWVGVFGSGGVAVLAYHSVSESSWTHAVSPAAFREQLAWLKRHAEIVSLEEAERPHAPSRKPRVAISFDDGYADWREAAKVLREFRMPATFFVTTSFRLVTSQPQTGLEPATPDDIRTLAAAGFEIGSHSQTHADFSVLEESEVRKEIEGSRDELVALSGKPVIRFSYPKGRHRKEAYPILASAGYVSAYAGHGAVRGTNEPFARPRVPTSGNLPLWRFVGRVHRALAWE